MVGDEAGSDKSVIPVGIENENENEMGGDSACWLSQVCPECGAMLEKRNEPCWRCGLRPEDA